MVKVAKMLPSNLWLRPFGDVQRGFWVASTKTTTLETPDLREKGKRKQKNPFPSRSFYRETSASLSYTKTRSLNAPNIAC